MTISDLSIMDNHIFENRDYPIIVQDLISVKKKMILQDIKDLDFEMRDEYLSIQEKSKLAQQQRYLMKMYLKLLIPVQKKKSNIKLNIREKSVYSKNITTSKVSTNTNTNTLLDFVGPKTKENIRLPNVVTIGKSIKSPKSIYSKIDRNPEMIPKTKQKSFLDTIMDKSGNMSLNRVKYTMNKRRNNTL